MGGMYLMLPVTSLDIAGTFSNNYQLRRLEAHLKVLHESYPLLNGTFCWSWSPMIFQRLFCIQCEQFLSTCNWVHALRQCLNLNEEKPISVHLRAKVILYSTSWHAKMSLTLNINCSLPKPPHYLQACTKYVQKHGRCCMQNNQLSTKGHDELEDNSIIYYKT